MRTLDKIRVQLLESLDNPVWNSLKGSLLGREIISFGSQVIYQTDRAFSSFFRNLYPDTADLKGLLYQSGFHKVPIQDYKPAYIVLLMPEDGGVVYSPYSLIVTSGTIYYTNIDFVRGSTSSQKSYATFYQGRVKCISSFSSSQRPNLGYRGVQEVPLNSSNFKKVTNSVSDERTQVILPSLAFSDSLKVFVGLEHIPVTEVSGLVSSPDNYNYSLYTDLDRTLRVVWGDGIVSKSLSFETGLSIYYVELTFSALTKSFVIINYPNSTEVTIQSQNVIAQSKGESYNLEAARVSLYTGISKKRVVSTRKQIEDFVKQSTEVLDVIVSDVDYNTIFLKVKPRSKGVTDSDVFSGLESDLQVYGELVTEYKIAAAEHLDFYLKIKTQGGVPEVIRAEVETKLKESFSYENIKFKANISENAVLDVISTSLKDFKTTIRVIAKNIALSGTKRVSLDLTPLESSIRIYDDTGRFLAWDRDGRILGFLSQQAIYFNSAFEVGDYILLKSVNGWYVLDPLDGNITRINIALDIISTFCCENYLFARHLKEGSENLAVFSLEGWRQGDLQKVTNFTTTFLPLNDSLRTSNLETVMDLSYLSEAQFSPSTNTLFIPTYQGGTLSIRAFQLQSVNMVHVATHAIASGIENPTAPIVKSSFKDSSNDYAVFRFTNSDYDRALNLRTLATGTLNFADTLKTVSYQEPTDGTKTIKVSNGVVSLISDAKVSVADNITILTISEQSVIVSISGKTELYDIVGNPSLVASLNRGMKIAVSSYYLNGNFYLKSNALDNKVYSQGILIPALSEVGVISYIQRLIEFNNTLQSNLTVTYSVADSLSALKDKYANFTEEVIWETT